MAKGSGGTRGASGGGNSAALEKNLRLWEGAIRNRDNEAVVAFDKDGNIAYLNQGDESSSEVDYTKIKDKVVTHNHPKESDEGLYRIGKSFSSDDIQVAVGANVKEMRVVTPTYTFSLKRPKGGWKKTESQVAKAFSDIAHGKIGQSDTKYWKSGKTQADKEKRVEMVFATHEHRVVKALAKQFGWTYTYHKN